MFEILKELNQENGSNYKMAVLKKHKDNVLLQRVLKMTYDKVSFTYDITTKNLHKFQPLLMSDNITLEESLDRLEVFIVSRKVTGNGALQFLCDTLASLSSNDAKILKKIIDRDLRINMGRSNINKVFKDLIIKPVYMRCDTYRHAQMVNGKIKKGTAHNIDYDMGAILQKKADGTYREFSIDDGKIVSHSRTGESYTYPLFFENMKNYNDGVYHGEVTVRLDNVLLNRLLPKLIKNDTKNGTSSAKELEERCKSEGDFILSRELGNGLLNSSDVPHNNLVLDLWDYITHDDYKKAALKDKDDLPQTMYYDRFNELTQIIHENKSNNIDVIESHFVFAQEEALSIVAKWMKLGYEGGIIKNKKGIFKDGTSKHQLKLKLEIECDMKITGFTAGTGKNADYFGAVTFENDERTIIGKVGVSSMTEDLRDWFQSNRSALIGGIMEVQFNDLSKARGNHHYALSHPRFIEMRLDKYKPDTLERVFENRQSAMTLKKQL